METLRSLGFLFILCSRKREITFYLHLKFDATVCNGLFLNHDIDLFTRLKLIQLTSAGFDRVPIDKIKEIAVLNFIMPRGVYSTPMAEWALFRVLEQYKQGWFFKTRTGST